MSMGMNTTVCNVYDSLDGTKLCLTSLTPWYYSYKSSLVSDIPDHYLALAAPVIAYWTVSLAFHFLDISGWKWLEKYRIHESAEVRSHNHTTMSEVVWAVLLQHLIQTIIGLVWLDEPIVVNHSDQMHIIGLRILPVLVKVIGRVKAQNALSDIVYFVYWWAIPAFQLLSAIFIMDTWQYFLHRWMHINKFMYKKIHSVHHRLYVPYAFGALYNHPVEGFLLDTLGAGIAELLTGMSTRQAMVFFVLSTVKTVDDHCGYSLPFDPLQLMTRNNADYHDIHHQIIGIKSNFSQPFFIHWDTLLGTRMTRQDVALRKHKQTHKVE